MLSEQLATGEIGRQLGLRMDPPIRSALISAHETLLYDAHDLVDSIRACRLRHVVPPSSGTMY